MVASKFISTDSSAHHKTKDESIDSGVVYERLTKLRMTLAETAKQNAPGDLSKLDDDLADTLAGVKAMQATIHEQSREIERLNRTLQSRSTDHSRSLEEAQALTHLGSWQWDIATDKISWSDELYRIYGMKPQERAISFDEFLNLIHLDDRQYVQGIITNSFQTGRPFEFEHRVILPSGDERILKGMGKTVMDKDNKPVRMLGTSQDITQAKQLDRAKDEFISLVSHQLRTPLSVIRMHGNVLEDGMAGPLDSQQENHIRTMTSASIRLIDLVDDILRISRISLNRIKINAAPSDPNKLIRDCVEEATPIAQEKGASIDFKADASIGLVPIDTTMFGEILRNLVSNAVRYSKDDNGRIQISFSKDNNGYLLVVSDNGIGIPPADQAYIFERFYRAHNATVVDSEGNGLGLYIVKLFTEAAGGKIRFDSTVGDGTTFYVSFSDLGMQPMSEKS